MKESNLFESLDKELDEAMSHVEGEMVSRTRKVKFKAGLDDSVEKEALNIIISETPDDFLIGCF